MIIGFPWETFDDHMESARKLSNLPIDYLKVHQLHVVKNTRMGNDYIKRPFNLLEKEQYFHILENFIARLNPNIIIQRLFGDVPDNLLLSPSWNQRSNALEVEFVSRLKESNLYQGKYWKK